MIDQDGSRPLTTPPTAGIDAASDKDSLTRSKHLLKKLGDRLRTIPDIDATQVDDVLGALVKEHLDELYKFPQPEVLKSPKLPDIIPSDIIPVDTLISLHDVPLYIRLYDVGYEFWTIKGAETWIDETFPELMTVLHGRWYKYSDYGKTWGAGRYPFEQGKPQVDALSSGATGRCPNVFNDPQIRLKLREAFPKCYVTMKFEIIIYPPRNSYFSLDGVGTETELKAKMLEWLSREASKTITRQSQAYHLKGINYYLGTNFSAADMVSIYSYLGNRVDHAKTLAFIQSGYDLSVLQGPEVKPN